MWEAQPEQMAQAIARHDALLAEAVHSHRGRVIKTTGDGIYATFADAADALDAAVAIQISLANPAATAGVSLRVRCGLHAGDVHERDNDFFGGTINRTARIMNAAYGGQVLISQTVADLARERLPAGVSLRDLGTVRLKGLTTSEAVYQLVHPTLYQNFPALRELEATPNNLPQQITSFIGRQRERIEAQALLTRTRLLTLLGMGGLGKTRLSLQIAADVMETYPDGTWFIDLAPITDPSLVASEAAQVLGVREEPGRPFTQTLCAHVKARKLLLILDNCEHLINESANLANALLKAAPDIRIIATSRQALRIPGEQTFPVLPLPVPERTAGVEELARSTAVQLFIERTKLHKPGFDLTEKDASAIAELVSRLDGIPLALELAAARMRALSVAEINKRLQDRFKLLTRGGRVLLPRQQTLRALVDWSYDLLQENEQLLLGRLCVFVGGFDLTAVEGVCGAEPLQPEDVLDVLSSLVEKSLVMVDDAADGSRYRLLETIRDYAREKLAERDELAKFLAVHFDHYLTVAKAANRGLQGPEQGEWTRRVEADLDNMRAGIALALQGGVDPILAVKFAVALLGFWMLRGYATEGRNYVRAALALPAVQGSDLAHAHALYVGAGLADSQSGHAEARRMLERCLELRRGLGNPLDIAAALSTLSLVRLHLGDATGAREGEAEAVDIFREIGNRVGEAIGLLHLAEICIYTGDDAQAKQHVLDALEIARDIENMEIESECERMLGELALESGDVNAATERFARSLDVCRKAEDKRGEATALWWQGKTDLAAGRTDLAWMRLSGALRAFQAFEMYAEMLGCLEDVADFLHVRDSPADATRFYAAVERLRDRLVLPLPPRFDARRKDRLALLRSILGDASFEAAWADGRPWGIEKSVRRALSTTTSETVAA